METLKRLAIESVSRIRRLYFSFAAFVSSMAVPRLACLLLLGVSASACADILGIDSPQEGALGALGGEGGQVDVGSTAGTPESDAGGLGVAGSGPSRAGAGASGPGDSGAGDSGAAGGPPSDGGAVGGGPRILGPDSTQLCPGAPLEIKLSVVGGQGPYVWRLNNSPTLSLQTAGVDHELATLSGSMDQALQVSIEAIDHAGQSALFDTKLGLLPVPVIELPAVTPSICPGEIYDAQLKATGGTASQYQWSSDDLPSSSGLTLAADGRLHGKFSGVPTAPASLEIHVNVADGGQCPATPLALSFHLRGDGATECPTIKVGGELSRLTAPALCLGGPYERQLSASGGTEPYVWSSSALPPGLSLATSGAITGTYRSNAPHLPAAEALTVQVKDGSGRLIEANYQVATRSACWFAYIAKSANDAKLSFFDAELGNRKLAPAAVVGDVVTDFQFSPDGRYVAYRVTTAANIVTLSVIDLVTWQEQRFEIQGVARYAWSPDATVLAVAYSVGSDSVLGGVTVSAASSSSGSTTSFSTIAPISASQTSDLAWFGATPFKLGFTTNNGGYPVLETFNLQTSEATGPLFGSPIFRTESLAPPIHFLAAPGGIFAIPKTLAIVYYPSDGSTSRSHSKVVVAPSGRFVAKAASGSVLVFHPTESSKGTTPLSQPGCDNVLSWAVNRERIACAHQTADPKAELNFLDIALGDNPSNDALSLSLNVPLEVPKTQRRLFSPNGDVFGFASDSSMTIVSLTGKVSKAVTEPAGESTELLFSGEQLLLQHRGTRLSWFDLSLANLQEIPISSALATATGCVEDFQDITVGWCGAERPGAPFMWSPDAKSIAFQLADGTLKIYKLLQGEQIPINDDCKQDCVMPGQFRFQP
jgi:WD40 repeat protein